MLIIKILYGILTLVTLIGWGLMIFSVIKEWKNMGRIKGTAIFTLVILLAVIGCYSLFNSYPF